MSWFTMMTCHDQTFFGVCHIRSRYKSLKHHSTVKFSKIISSTVPHQQNLDHSNNEQYASDMRRASSFHDFLTQIIIRSTYSMNWIRKQTFGKILIINVIFEIIRKTQQKKYVGPQYFNWRKIKPSFKSNKIAN